MENKDNFWIGPHDVRIPNSIDRVVASDGFNTLYKNGCQTEVACLGNDIDEYVYMSKTDYLKIFAEEKDGIYYYKKR